MQIGCFGIAIVFLALAFAVVFIQDNPWVIYVIVLGLIGLFAAYQVYRKKQENKNAEQMYALRPTLQRFLNGFEPITDSYLSLKQDEFVFYERDGVSLLEYKSSGSKTSGGYLGGNVRLSDRISVSGGGFEGQTTRNPEESTVIDTGSVIFTNQRAVFVGDNQTREFDFDKLLDLDVSVNGFTVRAAVSGRQKTSALQASAESGLTPGFAFAIGVALFKDGEEEAKSLVRQIVKDIDKQYSALVVGRNR